MTSDRSRIRVAFGTILLAIAAGATPAFAEAAPPKIDAGDTAWPGSASTALTTPSCGARTISCRSACCSALSRTSAAILSSPTAAT